jgi:hypothetical protein
MANMAVVSLLPRMTALVTVVLGNIRYVSLQPVAVAPPK